MEEKKMYERRITMPSFRFSIIVPTKMLPRGVEINLKKVALMQPDTMEGAELVVSQFDTRAEVVKGGIQITFWVPTVSEELMERLDALIDEEYEITKLDFTISNEAHHWSLPVMIFWKKPISQKIMDSNRRYR